MNEPELRNDNCIFNESNEVDFEKIYLETYEECEVL